MILKPCTYLLFAIPLFLAGCGQSKHNINQALQEEMANREIKKVSEGQITNAAYQRGKTIADTAQVAILSTLQDKLATGDSLETAFTYCKVSSYTFLDSLSTKLSVTIKRLGTKTRNEENNPDKTESALLDAYLYNIEQDLPLEDNVQSMGEHTLLYTKPIIINNDVCLKCHGVVGKDLSQLDYEAIKSSYPNDMAIGYKLGDFRGMYSIKISKKELIKDL